MAIHQSLLPIHWFVLPIGQVPEAFWYWFPSNKAVITTPKINTKTTSHFHGSNQINMKQFFLALTFTFITGLTFGQQPAQNHSSSASFLEKLQTDYLVESVSGKKGGGTDCDGTVQPQNQYTGLITQDLTITGQTILISGVLTVPAGVNLDISLCTVYMDPNSGIQVLDGGFLSVVGNTFSPCNGVNGGGISINGSAHSSLRHLIQDNSFSGAFAFVIAEETEGLDIINNTFFRRHNWCGFQPLPGLCGEWKLLCWNQQRNPSSVI